MKVHFSKKKAKKMPTKRDFIREKIRKWTGDSRDATTTTGPRGEGTKQNDNDDKMMMDDDDHEGDIEYDSDEEEQNTGTAIYKATYLPTTTKKL